MTEQKKKEKLMSIVRTHEKLVKQMEDIRLATDGEIDFGAFNEEQEIMLYRGIKEIASLIDVRPKKTGSGIKDFPTETSVMVSNTKLFQIG